MTISLKQGTYVRDAGEERDTCIPEFHLVARPFMVDGKTEYRDVEMVKIIMPGNSFTIPNIPVTDIERARWPKSYAAFLAGQEAPVDGIPLEEWPVLTKAEVMTLKSRGFRTVENLADMNEHAIQQIMGGRILKKKAQAYLDEALRDAVTNQALENEARLQQIVEEQNNRIQSLNEQLNNLGDQMRQVISQQSRAAENIATTPGLAMTVPEANVTHLVTAGRAFSRFAEEEARESVIARNAESKASIDAWKASQTPGHHPTMPPIPPAEVVPLGVQGGMPAKKRGRKSNAEKAAESARLVAGGE